MTALFPADFQKTKMINLLPPLRQKQIAEEEAAKTVAIIVMIAAAALLFFAATLFVIRIFYQYELKNAEILLEEKKVIAGMRDVSAVESQIALGNVLAAEITGFDRRQTKITEVFLRVAECLPAGAYLSSFQFSQNRIDVEGISPDRDILALFKKNLESRPDFTKVVFPASNWLSASDIEFSASFEYVKN